MGFILKLKASWLTPSDLSGHIKMIFGTTRGIFTEGLSRLEGKRSTVWEGEGGWRCLGRSLKPRSDLGSFT